MPVLKFLSNIKDLKGKTIEKIIHTDDYLNVKYTLILCTDNTILIQEISIENKLGDYDAYDTKVLKTSYITDIRDVPTEVFDKLQLKGKFVVEI